MLRRPHCGLISPKVRNTLPLERTLNWGHKGGAGITKVKMRAVGENTLGSLARAKDHFFFFLLSTSNC